LKERVLKLNIRKEETLAIGDGDNDIAMIKYANLGIAWRAYPKVKRQANLNLDRKFKTILYLQGYSEEDIV
jgi:phosphoserine phosphatase